MFGPVRFSEKVLAAEADTAKAEAARVKEEAAKAATKTDLFERHEDKKAAKQEQNAVNILKHERERWEKEREELKAELTKTKGMFKEAKLKLQEAQEVSVMLEELCSQAGLI